MSRVGDPTAFDDVEERRLKMVWFSVRQQQVTNRVRKFYACKALKSEVIKAMKDFLPIAEFQRICPKRLASISGRKRRRISFVDEMLWSDIDGFPPNCAVSP